jgi:enoyl-[acyl-carrier-protein] reductase (NADH)
MPNGGTLMTLTFQGSNRVTPNYNVMGVAKAALESRRALSGQRPRAAEASASTPSRPAR